MSVPLATGWLACSICGTQRYGGPPHGEDIPCPQAVKLNTAKVEMLEAQKASFLGSGMAAADAGAALKKMMSRPPFGSGDDD